MKCRYLPDLGVCYLTAIALTILILLIAGCSDDETTGPDGGSASAWRLVSPTVEGNLYRGVHFTDATTGWLVGVDGLILKTTDGGTTWMEQASQTNRTLRAVDFVTPRIGFAVGDEGRLLRTENGGVTWSNPLIRITDRPLNAVDGVTPRKAFAVGEQGILFYSLDAGRRWAPDTVDLDFPLYDIVVFDTSAVAVGADGFIVRFFGYDNEIERLMADTTVDTFVVNPDTLPGGFPLDTLIDTLTIGDNTVIDTTYRWMDTLIDTTYFTVDTLWSQREVVAPVVVQNLRGVTHAGGGVLWAVGDSGAILRSADRGVNWTEVSSGVTSRLTSVIAGGGGTGIATGFDGTLLRTIDNGVTWAPVALGLELDLFAGTAATAGAFWAVGDVAVYRSSDAGATWDRLSTGTSAIPTLTDITFIGSDSGFAVGYAGTILRTTDGGQNWETLRQGSFYVPSEWFSAVDFTDNLNGWAVGRAGLAPYYHLLVVRTSDGGESWERFAFPDVPPDAQDPPIPDTGWGQDVVFVDNLTGYACTDANILLTTDGGASWEFQVNPDTAARTIYGLCFVDAIHGWAVGSEGLVLRTTDGITWTVLMSTVIDGSLYAVDFINTDTGVAVGAAGIIWRTTDGGATWSEITSPTNRTLVDVTFSDNRSGKAVGQSGTILSTGDAGLTWTVQPAPTNETLTGVDMISNNVGWIVGGYVPGAQAVMLHTTTGGN